MYPYVNHPDVAHFRGVNPYQTSMRYGSAPMPYGRGGTSSSYELSGFTASAPGGYGAVTPQLGWNTQSNNTGYRGYGSPYNQYLAYDAQRGCNCPGQICCKGGECVSSITACPEFTWGQMGNRFQNPTPKHWFMPHPSPMHLYSTRPDKRARLKKRRSHRRYNPNVVNEIFTQLGLRRR